MTARSHSCGVLEGGTVLLYGGIDSAGLAVKQMQTVTPLIGALPGGVPADVAPDMRLRCAGHMAALMHVRCALAQALRVFRMQQSTS